MTKKEKRNLLIAASAVFLALWVGIVAFGEVLGVSDEARDTIQNVANFIGVAASAYVMKVVAGLKDTDGDGFPDA